MAKTPTIKVDAEFQSLNPALPRKVYDDLEADILTNGCITPLVVWKGQDILVDGHNRHHICKKHQIAFKVQPMAFEDRDEACEWILTHQLARRNLTESQIAYAEGKLYAIRKKRQGPQSAQNAHIEPGKTADVIAEERGVDPATVRRNAKFAEAVDSLPEEIREEVLSDDHCASKADIVNAAKEPTPEKRKAAAKAAMRGEKPKSEPKPKDGITDALGARIADKRIAEAFANIDALKSMMQACSSLKREVGEIAEMPVGAWLREYVQQISADLDSVRSAIKFSLPYALMPAMKGESEWSKRAAKIGFITQKQYEMWKSSK